MALTAHARVHSRKEGASDKESQGDRKVRSETKADREKLSRGCRQTGGQRWSRRLRRNGQSLTVRADHGADDAKALRDRTGCKLAEAGDHGSNRKEVRNELDRRVVHGLEVVRDKRQRAKSTGERVEGEDEAERDEATDRKRSRNWQVRGRVENRVLAQEGLSFSVAAPLRRRACLG